MQKIGQALELAGKQKGLLAHAERIFAQASVLRPSPGKQIAISGTLTPEDRGPTPMADAIIQHGSASVSIGADETVVKQQIAVRLPDIGPRPMQSRLTLTMGKQIIASLSLPFSKANGGMRAGRIRLELLGNGSVLIARYLSGQCKDVVVWSLLDNKVACQRVYTNGGGRELQELRRAGSGSVTHGVQPALRNVIVLNARHDRGKTKVGSTMFYGSPGLEGHCWAAVDDCATISEGESMIADHLDAAKSKITKVSTGTITQLRGEIGIIGEEDAEAEDDLTYDLWRELSRMLRIESGGENSNV